MRKCQPKDAYEVDRAAGLLAPADGSLELQQEFCTFLAPLEGRSFRTTAAGEVGGGFFFHYGTY